MFPPTNPNPFSITEKDKIEPNMWMRGYFRVYLNYFQYLKIKMVFRSFSVNKMVSLPYHPLLIINNLNVGK